MGFLIWKQDTQRLFTHLASWLDESISCDIRVSVFVSCWMQCLKWYLCNYPHTFEYTSKRKACKYIVLIGARQSVDMMWPGYLDLEQFCNQLIDQSIGMITCYVPIFSWLCIVARSHINTCAGAFFTTLNCLIMAWFFLDLFWVV